ncbi:MAG TPA: ABC transporter ATP-binding protein [bacterium]|jgi:multiple sugar transport system ATP-binding protein|nr:ABC transporter ATP-binding protein [bacterium]
MATIILDRMRKEFGATVAVDDVSLEIPSGRLACLLGPSGCGKTTTLRMIAGLETPTAGEIRFDGRRMNDIPPQRRGVGMVFQNYALFTHLSVYENLAFGLRVRGVTGREVDQAVHRFAELLELEALLGTGVARLDLSTMQRVALGRTLITQPHVLLLDEPLNNIRPGLRETMRAELRRLQLELRQTAVYVTHDQEEALSLGDQIIIMRQAQVEQVGTPEEVYGRPRNRFVATFVGSPTMNLLPCRLAQDDGRLRLVADGLLFGAERWARAREAGPDLLLGIRPERLTLGSGGLQAQVTLVQSTGAEQVLELMIGAHRLKAVAGRDRRFSPGQTVRLDFPSPDLYLFDARTGEALYE